MRVKSGLVVLMSLSLGACAGTGDVQPDAAGEQIKPGTVLIFHEQEAGAEAARMVYFINADTMRINEWQDPNDFILFDRNTRTIYNVVASDKTILVIKDRPVNGPPPLNYELGEAKEKSSAAVRSKDGLDAWHYRYTIGDAVCYNTVSMEGYLPEVVQALKEFRQVLAGEHAKGLGSTPPDMLDPCDLAMNIFESGRYLDKGFPLREWNDKGYQRFLVDVRYEQVPPAVVLQLPEGYKQYSIPGPE